MMDRHTCRLSTSRPFITRQAGRASSPFRRKFQVCPTLSVFFSKSFLCPFRRRPLLKFRLDPVSLEEKMEDVTQLWSPEEDGLYVGHPPKCARRRWQILERRLVTHAADKAIKTKWFRTDGTVSVQPDPLRPYLVRNIIPTREPRPVYQTVYPQKKLDNQPFNSISLIHLSKFTS